MLDLQSNPRQTRDTVGIVIFGNPLGPFPYPAHVMKPAPHGPRGNLKAMFGLELGRQRGAAPAGTAPAIGARWHFEQGAQLTSQTTHQSSLPVALTLGGIEYQAGNQRGSLSHLWFGSYLEFFIKVVAVNTGVVDEKCSNRQG